jgi:hypothetical protein
MMLDPATGIKFGAVRLEILNTQVSSWKEPISNFKPDTSLTASYDFTNNAGPL